MDKLKRLVFPATVVFGLTVAAWAWYRVDDEKAAHGVVVELFDALERHDKPAAIACFTRDQQIEAGPQIETVRTADWPKHGLTYTIRRVRGTATSQTLDVRLRVDTYLLTRRFTVLRSDDGWRISQIATVGNERPAAPADEDRELFEELQLKVAGEADQWR